MKKLDFWRVDWFLEVLIALIVLVSAQSNRMLGLAYQGQGQFDTAFDYFRKLPVDDGIMDALYNLALDFERKRQFNKAESVFRYMADYNPKFRDLDSRLNRAKAMSETVILGGAGGGHPGGTVILPGGGVEKPMLGTPSYLSPEPLSGQKIEGRSDLFSLGVALYQMASGRLPFQGDSMAQLMFKIANKAHADIRTHNPKLPACVAAIVNKALAKDPDQRYQDGEQMAKALRLCLQSLSAARQAAAPAPSAPAAPATSS